MKLSLDATLAVVGNGIPIGAHFTANYPVDFPRDTFLTNWSQYDGRVHLMWQANPADSAGKQAAMLYYAPERVNPRAGWRQRTARAQQPRLRL